MRAPPHPEISPHEPADLGWLGIGNWLNVVRGREFRAYLHDPAAMLGISVRNGLRLVMEHHGPTWSIARFERQAA